MSASPALREVQARFLAALTGADEPASALADLRTPSVGVEARLRLQVYRNNYRFSLTDALAAVYPVLRQLVGDDYFDSVAREFIALHPPSSAQLASFGAELPAHLSASASAAALPYLADVAALEWARHEVYAAADAAPLDAAALGDVPAEQHLDLSLALVPAARLVASAYPVLAIWQAHQEPVMPEFRLSLDDGASRVLVLRRELDVVLIELDEAEMRWLMDLQAGVTLADATLRAFECDAAFYLGTALGRHLSLGTFGALSFAGVDSSHEAQA